MSAPRHRLVFTDLDGSLLDHHTYSFAPARALLAELDAAAVPVIAISSKTRVEIESIRAELGNRHPFIVENGAAVFIPRGYFSAAPSGTVSRGDYWVYEMSGGRQRWLDALQHLQARFAGEFDHFYRAGTEGIMSMTGLDATAAELANQREYSEPVQWLGDASRKQAFIAALQALGARTLQGGRFLTVAGECDKGRALAWLRNAYRGAWGVEEVVDIAAGDSGNDVAMLEVAGTALLIRSPVHDYPVLQRSDHVLRSTRCGPDGWVEGIRQWLAVTATDNQEYRT